MADRFLRCKTILTAYYKYVYDGQGNLVRSIDIKAKKEYNYLYENGKIYRLTESDIELTSDEIVIKKSVLCTVQYIYDAEDTLTQKRIIWADGKENVINYENLENDSQIVTFTAGGKTVTSHSKTDSFGRKVFDELQLDTGFVSRQFSYVVGETTDEHVESGKLKSSPTTQLVSQIVMADGHTISYEYDAEERITKVTDSIDGVTEYTYDELGQLLTETKNGEVINTMVYDAYGNILQKNGIPYTYNAIWKDRLSYYNGEHLIYDAQGNPTNYLDHNLTWEKGRQLKSFDDIIYTYNANGIRTSKTVDGIKHTYVLDGTKILKETWDDEVLETLYDNEDNVCGIVYNGDAYYFLKNLQGDVIAITDSSGETVAEYTYDAWGKLLSVSGDNISIASINPYRYRGYYFDSQTNLYYLQSRYYDANIGRFINADEIYYLAMNSIQLNTLFVYSDNSPVMNSDPLGNVSISSVKTSVDLCINSPNPNSSVVFAQKGRDFTAGHVYLVLNPGKDQNLKKKYGTCAFGFAPRSQRTMVITIQQFLNPKVYARGRIMDESKNRFSVFVRFNITKTQFENVVKYKNKMQKSPPNYNLIKFNCATFALSVLEKAGIKHKFKPKFWNFGANLLFFLMLGVRKLYFKGYTPAQMAYDVLHGKIK